MSEIYLLHFPFSLFVEPVEHPQSRVEDWRGASKVKPICSVPFDDYDGTSHKSRADLSEYHSPLSTEEKKSWLSSVTGTGCFRFSLSAYNSAGGLSGQLFAHAVTAVSQLGARAWVSLSQGQRVHGALRRHR